MQAQGSAMAVKSAVNKLIARENLARAERGEKPLSQRQIAQASGVPQSVISTLANNQTRRIDFGTIDNLCKFFKVTPDALFDFTAAE